VLADSYNKAPKVKMYACNSLKDTTLPVYRISSPLWGMLGLLFNLYHLGFRVIQDYFVIFFHNQISWFESGGKSKNKLMGKSKTTPGGKLQETERLKHLYAI
jgi:hypothetical protein